MRQWKRDGDFLDMKGERHWDNLPATMYEGDFPQPDCSAIIAGNFKHLRPVTTEVNRKKIAQTLVYRSTYV